MNVSNVSSLIAALSIETAAASITPSRLGNILSQLVALLQNVPSGDEINGLNAAIDGLKSKLTYAVSSIGTPTRTSTAVSIPYVRTHVTSGAASELSVSLPTASSSSAGLMSASDKAKLDSLSSSGGAGSSSPSGAGDSYDHSGLESAIAALQGIIGTVNVNQLATWYADCASPIAAMRQAQSEPTIYVVLGAFNGKHKACGVLFAFMDDMNNNTQPHAIHQMFFTNFTNPTSFGHDGGIHLWHRLYGITIHHGTQGAWSEWTELPFGGGSGCTCAPVTTTADGLMLASDKSKLDRLAISSISLSGNTLTINGNSFTLTPVGSGGSTPSGGGSSSGGEVSLVYFGSVGTADGSLTATQARTEAHSATLASLLTSLHSTSQTSFSDVWNKAAFFIVFPKGKYSSISANATTALGSTAYSLAAGTIVKSTSSSDDYDIYFVTNKAISSSNTASMSVVLS